QAVVQMQPVYVLGGTNASIRLGCAGRAGEVRTRCSGASAAAQGSISRLAPSRELRVYRMVGDLRSRQTAGSLSHTARGQAPSAGGTDGVLPRTWEMTSGVPKARARTG